MSILNVDKIQPIGGGSTITVDATDIQATSATITASSFVGSVTGTASNASNASGATGDFSIVDKIVHTGDTNTAIRFPASDTITAETGGSERLRIKSDGKVGINQAAPEALLHIEASSSGASYTADAADTLILERNGGCVIDFRTPAANDGGLIFSDNSARAQGTLLYQHSDNSLRFGTAGSERLRINSTGRVGIGSEIPNSKLEVWNGSNIEVLRLKDTHYNKFLTIRGGGSPNRMVIDSYEGGGGGADIDLASNGSTKLRITSSGDVTIPVDSKKFLAGAGNDVRMFHDGSDSYFDSITGNLYVYNHASGNLDLGTGGNTRFRIGSAGQLGIGGATYGSSGQVLTSQGSGAAPQWATASSGGWTVHSTTSASGNSEISVTSGLSDSTTTIEIIVHKLRAGNGTAAHQVQIGTSSGWAGTYNDIQRYFNSSGSQETNRGHDQNQFSAWHGQGNPFSQDYMEFSGTFTLNKVSTGNYVMESQSIGDRTDNNTQYLLVNSGRVELGAALSRIRIFTSNSSNFSSGTVVIRSM